MHKVVRLLGALAITFLISLPKNTIAAPPVITQATAIDDLDNAAWVPDGPPSDKQIYIIAAPWCPICKQLYASLRTHPTDVQYRWIITGGRDQTTFAQACDLSFNRDASKLAILYKRALPSVDTAGDCKWAAAWNTGTMFALWPSGAVFPVLVWSSPTGMKSVSGIPGNLDKVLADVVARPGTKDLVPQATAFAGKLAGERAIASTSLFAIDRDVQLHAVPSEVSPVVFVVERTRGYDATKLAKADDGRTWAYFRLWKQGSIEDGAWALLDDMRLNDGRRLGGL